MHDMTPKRFAKAYQETTAPAKEVIEHLYQALINLPPFTLKDGTPVRTKSYQTPELNEAGEAECGVDVVLPNGHLEFTIRNSGWGKAFAPNAKPAKKGTRQR